ncbi:hypothetical protein SAMN04488120_101235 [Fontimonas thermophila]|uniref:Uncharacterized protein n=1 Tax=Fontimonas thermophila TaxID=1076937 RepID=A0A1I2HAI8_9GAMM|nr:hypothetical protein [Fontimonas thermophila]SFF25977.1 hypothetical protein SAMN04488120_101235 [Fontimonas thermophila]
MDARVTAHPDPLFTSAAPARVRGLACPALGALRKPYRAAIPGTSGRDCGTAIDARRQRRYGGAP